MKSAEFTARKGIIVVSWLGLFLMIGLQVVMNVYFIISWKPTYHFIAVILGNVFLTTLNIPSIIIFMNYQKHSRNMRLVLMYETLQLFRNDELICSMINSEITLIERVEASGGKVFWSDFGYVKFIDKIGKEIIVTHYILNLGKFWMNSLSRKISNKNITVTRRFFPYIKENPAWSSTSAQTDKRD